MLENEYFRDTWAEINLDDIEENVKNMKNRMAETSKLFAVVKANGYGHGAAEVARTALLAGADYLAVAFLDEALSLRNAGINAPILVLGASRPSDILVAAKQEIVLTVFDVEWLTRATEYLQGNKIKIHVKIDSGMGRLGIRKEQEVKEIEEFLLQHQEFNLEGIYTHFATADEKNSNYLNDQAQKFADILASFKAKPPIIHCSNSAAGLLYPELAFNGVRLGIAMYGLPPSVEIKEMLPFSLKEAFSLHTKIVQVKKLHKGDKVSYGATYEAKEDEWIATLPIGYADGWLRKLQGQEVLVNGIRVPIVGRVCMDQCMIKLPHEIAVGTKVTLIGTQQKQCISVNEIAKKLDTINYEVTCTIANRVPRVYLKAGTVDSIVNNLLN
ncbi:alanine racemase [Niallia circulans]|uniref:Alanine racemase n=1 Tax=Niallia circulans TaxID=1397 RepID=A0A553SPY7_NIACI|nr:alanine racemase [Niallia circulans]TRZ39038.1 alanine racemase [Niallia circulans]